MVRVHPPAATPNVRDPFRVTGEGPGATTHPRSPAPTQSCGSSGILSRGWRLRPWAPFSSSDFLFLLPFVCLPGELRAIALPGAPLLPLPSGTPLLSRHPGATGGRQFPPSLFGRGMMECYIHHPSGVAPVGPGEVQRRYPPHPGGHDAVVPRRLSSAPPISSPSAPRVLPWGLGHRSRRPWRPEVP
jgi:hypothetical protein